MKKILSGLCLYLIVVTQVTAFGAIVPPQEDDKKPNTEVSADAPVGEICAPGIFEFEAQGVPPTGPAGNIRTFTKNDVGVRVSAFNRRNSGGQWGTAFLFLNKFGLGVTDTTGDDETLVDNEGGSVNYVLFEFSTPVVVDRVFLQKIGADSDATAWIGMTDDPYNNHNTLSDAFLALLGAEQAPDGGGPNRWADINAGSEVGNVLVFAPRPNDPRPNDKFFINKLDIKCSTEPTPTPTPTPTPNVPPDAVNDSATVAEDSGANTIDVLANDSDGDGGTLTITAVTQPTGGLVANNGTNVTFTPATNFAGSTSFTYTISDGQGGSDTATVSVTVMPVNDAPDAVDDSASVQENSTNNTISVLANDSDADGDQLTITAVSDPANGTVVNNGNNVSYTPDANFTGTDTFTYTISDGNGGTDTATVTITVTNVNINPDAVDDAATVAEDSTNNAIDVLANDTDGDGDTLTITAATQGANGSVTFTATGVSYTPNANFFGTDTFTYTISDGNGGSDTATVTVTVTDVPESAGQLLVNEVEFEGPGEIPNNCQYVEIKGQNPGGVVPANTWFITIDNSNANPGNVAYAANIGGTTVGANGTITLLNSATSGCPNRVYGSGTTIFTSVQSLGLGFFRSRAFLLVESSTPFIGGFNVDQNQDGQFDFPVTVIDGFAFTINPEEEFNYGGTPQINIPIIPPGGTLDVPDAATRFLGDTTPINAGSWYYGELAGAPEETTTYIDPRSPNFPAGGRLTPGDPNTLGAGNQSPNAADDSAMVAEDSGANAIDVLANDTDPDGGTLTVTAATNGSNGSVTFTATGVSYTPNANFSGSDSFTYTISDGQGGSDTATVTVTVGNVNDAPDAVDDAATVAEDSTNNVINVLSNDVDIDGDSLTVSAVTQPANGSVVNNGTNVSYTPNVNFTGVDTFTYSISDGNGGSDTATVTVTVGGTNDAPDAVNDSATVAEDSGANAINVLANDTDGDGDTLTVTAVTQGANGSVTFTPTGVSYTPNANFNGSDSFTYTISDGNGGSDTATVSVTVTPVNDAPDAVNDSANVAEDSTNNIINVLANDTDGDGDTLTVTAVTQGANGSVTFTATGVSYTPNANFNGPDSFTYTISDGHGGTDTATVNVTVTGVNDAPDAVNDSATVAENSGANAINVLANDTDIDAGQTLSVTAATQPATGSVTFTATGVSYTPNANFSGVDTFTYTISDGNGGTDTATVTVTVTNVNQNPDAVDDTATVAEDSGANAINVLANDTDVDGDAPTVTAVTQGANGSVTFTASGVSYTPNANFSGSDSFTYTVSDGNGGSDTATVSVTVTGANDAPVANDDSATVVEDSTNNVINVLANDTDIDAGQTLTVSAVTQGSNGTVVNNSSNVSYTPAPDFFGTDSFTYTVSDGNGGTDTATVSVTVTDVPDETPAGQLLVNEVEMEPPSTLSDGCQYVEIRAANPGGTVPANTWFITIDNSAANPGNIAFATNIGGTVVGSNGTISINNSGVGTCPGRTFDPGTTLVTVVNPLGLGFTTFSRAYLLVTSVTPFLPGQNIDQDQDGQFDFPVTVVDGFAFNVNPEEEFNYGGAPQINIPGLTELPDAVTRFSGNTIPLDFNAFYWGELAASPDSTTTYAAPFSANFPAGGVLTPGAPNLP